MRLVVFRVARATGIVLALSLAGELIFDLLVRPTVIGCFYAGVSSALLGFVASSPLMVDDPAESTRLRITAAVCLLPIVIINCVLASLANGSALRWSADNNLLTGPLYSYLLCLTVSFLANRRSTKQPS